jgi:HD superfamily phosphohydrolase
LFKAVEINAEEAFRDPRRPWKKNKDWNWSKKAKDRVEAARELIRSRGLPDDYYFLTIISADTPYRPYAPDDKNQKNIWIETPDGGYRDVSEVSGIVRALQASDYNLVRFVFPETDPSGRDLREPIEEILGPLIPSPA